MKDLLFEAFLYSLLNLTFTGWIPYLLLSNGKTGLAIFSFIVVLTASPLLLAYLYIKFIGSQFFMRNFNIQVPTAWDWYFNREPNPIVLVHMKDGADVFGYFGSRSYATSYPNDGGLYLEKVYTKSEDGNLKLIDNSDGILIAKDQYTSIEFFSIGD